MDASKVDSFLMAQSDNLPAAAMSLLKERLLAADESKFLMLMSVQFKSPIVALVLSLFIGSWGIDRFFIGDTGLGIGKLLTCGGCGIWTIVDWFLIMRDTKKKNMDRLLTFLP
ncbi:MAG: TM2 domain-containing protein [Bacteroidaceae bacterium]